VHRFEQFITSDLRGQATQLQTTITAIIEGLPDITVLSATIEAELRGAPEPIASAAAKAVSLLDRRVDAARRVAAGAPTTPMDAGIDLDPIDAYARAQDETAQRHADLRDEQRQRALLRKRDELRARATGIAADSEIRDHVAGLARLARLEHAVAQLNTQRISAKLRELQQLAITERLRKAVEEELSHLHPVIKAVQITGQASKGQTLIHLTLKADGKAKITHVLSDGEQRALALAFFLAELAVSEERSAIVLDARRLATEAQRRQVVVLTHDMVFVHLLQEAADELGVGLHGRTLQRAFAHIGMVSDELPLKMLAPAKQLHDLAHRLRFELRPTHARQDPAYEQEADRWVMDLRKTYDHVIEATMLNGSVRRFHAHVRVRQLHGIKWTPDRAQRIDTAMSKASPKAHHEALALHPTPHTPDELQAMLDELTALYDEMRADRPAQQAPSRAVPPEAEPVVRVVQRQS
jgi:hypothetical protein